MSSQSLITRDVNLRQNALGADAPVSAPEVQSSAPATASPAPEMNRRPMARADRKGETFGIVAHESAQPAKMAIGRMLTTKEAASLLGRPHSTLERWRCEGRGPDYMKEEGECGTMRTVCGNTSAETRGHLPCERSWR
jgi:hypothetical protein